MKKFLIILLFMILPNLASFCNKAGGLSEDAYNNEGEYTQQEEDKKKVKWEVIKKNIEKEVHDYYNNTMNDVTDRTKKLVNEIEIGAERDKKNKYFKEEVEQKGIAFKKKTKDLKYAFSKLFPYRKKEFTNMEFRYKINKEIILYADMVENVTKGQLIKKSKNYYDTFLEASKHVITFAYEEQTNLEAMREHYKNKNDLLNINSNEVNDLKDKINLLNPQIIKDVSRKSGFDEYYQKSIAKEKKCKSKLSIIENLLAQHEKTRQRMMDLEQKYHDAPFKTVVLTIGENKELNENVNKLSEFKKNIEDMDKNKIDNERKEMNDRGIRKDLFHEKFHTKTSAIDFDKNRLDKYYNKLHREKLEGYETSIPGSKFYPYDLNLSKEYMKSKFDTYAKNLQIQTDKGGMPDKVFIEYSAKMISTSYMKSKCAYEILKIKVNYIAKNKEYSEFLAEYENDLALNKQALEKLRKFQIDTIEFLKKKGVNPNEYQFNKNVLGDVDADILFDK